MMSRALPGEPPAPRTDLEVVDATERDLTPDVLAALRLPTSIAVPPPSTQLRDAP